MPGDRRDSFMWLGESAPPGAHWGLWLDRYLEGADAESHGKHIAAIVDRIAPDGYADRFRSWRDGFERNAAPDTFLVLEAEVRGRMIVGLGSRGVLEAGIRLDHTWGVPVIPGSSLKGLAGAAAHQLTPPNDAHWKKPETSDAGARPDSDYDVLFGSTDECGAVRFHDAWWIPETGQGKPLRRDVMTVHHPSYYQAPESAEPPPPSDTDSPTPIAFLSAVGRFLIVIEGANDAWRRAAADFLAAGLRELGVGAKTNAGYGRMALREGAARYMTAAERDAAKEEERIRLEAEMTALRRGLRDRFGRVDRGNFQRSTLAPLFADLDKAYPARETPERLELLRTVGQRLTKAWLETKANGDIGEFAETILRCLGGATPVTEPTATPQLVEDPRTARVNRALNGQNPKETLRKLVDEAIGEKWPKVRFKELVKALERVLPKPSDRRDADKNLWKKLKDAESGAP